MSHHTYRLVQSVIARLNDRSERGASAVEYGLLITGIAALISLVIFTLGDGVGALFSNTCDSLSTSATGTGC